jgi:acetyltransferase-like isoleucine patch superfamily enzyme
MSDIFDRVRGEALLYVCNRIVARIPSHTVRLSFYRRLMQFEIGPESYVFMDAWFDSRGGFKMGRNSVVNQRCRMDTRGGIVIGENVSVAAETCILTADHDPQSPTFEARIGPVTIEDYAVIGTRAIILRDLIVGRGSVVAAGAVVTKSVAPFTIVAGSPAKPIGRRAESLEYCIDYRRLFG